MHEISVEDSHNQDNPKEKHLWTQESPVALFEVIRECKDGFANIQLCL